MKANTKDELTARIINSAALIKDDETIIYRYRSEFKVKSKKCSDQVQSMQK